MKLSRRFLVLAAALAAAPLARADVTVNYKEPQTNPAQVLFHPHWFNAVGVLLLALGVGLLIRAFEQRPFSQLVLAADARRPEPPSDD